MPNTSDVLQGSVLRPLLFIICEVLLLKEMHSWLLITEKCSPLLKETFLLVSRPKTMATSPSLRRFGYSSHLLTMLCITNWSSFGLIICTNGHRLLSKSFVRDLDLLYSSYLNFSENFTHTDSIARSRTRLIFRIFKINEI